MNAEVHSGQGRRYSLVTILVAVFVSAAMAAATAMFAVSMSTPPSSDRASDRGINDLVSRLERLEQDHAQEPGSNEPAITDDVKAETTAVLDYVRDMEERLTQLEATQEARQVVDRRRADFEEHVRRIGATYTYETAIRTMSDSTADDEMKAIAWRTIRFSAAEAWTDDIVMEAVRIGTTSPDPWLRADIWRQAHANFTNPLLLQPLLQALASDPDARVRSEAAETLDLYIDEAGVRDALQSAGEYDASSDVRRQAKSSLKGPDGGY